MLPRQREKAIQRKSLALAKEIVVIQAIDLKGTRPKGKVLVRLAQRILAQHPLYIASQVGYREAEIDRLCKEIG